MKVTDAVIKASQDHEDEIYSLQKQWQQEVLLCICCRKETEINRM